MTLVTYKVSLQTSDGGFATGHIDAKSKEHVKKKVKKMVKKGIISLGFIEVESDNVIDLYINEIKVS